MTDSRDVILASSVFAGLIMTGVGMFLGADGMQAAGFLLAGVGAMGGMVDTCKKGVIETNWGIVRRAECPIWFQVEAAFWSTLIAIWTLGGILVSLGVIGHKK